MTDDLDDLIVAAVGDVRDPYPEFAEFRANQPVRAHQGFNGEFMYSVYRYDDVARVLREPEMFSSRVYAPAIGMVFGPSILQMDGAEHHSHRSLIGGAFRRSVLVDWEKTLIEPVVQDLVDGFSGRGAAELVRALTIRFPIQIIARILGIPSDDFARFTRLSIQLIGIATDIPGGMRASAELRDYFSGILEQRRSAPQDDLISTLAGAHIEGAPLPDEEIFGFLRLLLPAGAETTYRLLGNLLFALLSNPSQLDAVRDDRALLTPAIEEALRWEAPVQFVSREAVQDVELGGVTIPAGSHVSSSIGSANHDASVFVEPDTYDMRAPRAPHLSFAEGPHRCLGEHLARMEVVVAMNVVLDRLKDLRLEPGGVDPHVQGVPFRSPNAIPVRFSPERA